jgi:hypothetical protein
MNRYRLIISYVLLLITALLCTGCGGGGGGDAENASLSLNGSSDSNSTNSLVTVTGTVNGLTTGQQVTLINNGSDSQTITSSGDGSFSFPTQLPRGSAFKVTVGTQPISQVCSVSNGTGQATVTNVIRVIVSCSETTYTVSTIVSSLNLTSGLAIDTDSNIYISQYVSGQPLMANVYSNNGILIKNVTFSNSGFQTVPFAFGLTIDPQNNVFVVDPSKNILAMTQAGVQSTFITNFLGNCRKAMSDTSGNIFFVGCYGSPIHRLSHEGVLTSFSSTAQLSNAITSITMDYLGNFFVTSGNQILKLVFDGSSFTTSPFAGSQAPGFSDGIGSQASFNNATSVAADNKGNLFVYDSGNFKVRKITPFGVVTTVAGTGSSGNEDGPGSTASFTSCKTVNQSTLSEVNYCNVAVDKSGNIIVLQSTSGWVSSIRKLTPN